MHRTLTPELMDDPNVPRDQLALSLRYIRAVNRVLGGESSLLRHLKAWSCRWPKDRPITLLDVATGSADLPLAARRWAERRGYDLRITGVDKHHETLAFAREHTQNHPAIDLRHADALTLDRTFEPTSFDYVHAGLFLHHLSDEDIITVLRQMNTIARRGLIWNDLVRSTASARVIRLLTLGMPHIVKHDARVSVAAGFTREEAESLAQRAGITYTTYTWRALTHRFTIAGEKPVQR
ncbi:MAG TPA: methyltransferase domain-containing protein [Phycisphaerales bacterium]|nr:methyltransferase domain-containing protein [Phycisphaerales bacterium]